MEDAFRILLAVLLLASITGVSQVCLLPVPLPPSLYSSRISLTHIGVTSPDSEPWSGSSLTWNSNENPTQQILTNGTIAVGDHVAINASFPTQMSWIVLQCMIEKYYCGRLVTHDPTNNPHPLPLGFFAWERVTGVWEGDTISISIDFTNDNTDAMMWWADTDNSTWDSEHDLLGNQMMTDSRPECSTFVPDRNGTLVIGILDRSNEEGNYSLLVYTNRVLSSSSFSYSVSTDTYVLGNASLYLVDAHGLTMNRDEIRLRAVNVTVCNLFAPGITGLRLDGVGTNLTLTWTILDRNHSENHTSDVYVSIDAGASFQPVVLRTTETRCPCDFLPCLDQMNWIAKVVVRDSSGLVGEASRYFYSWDHVIPPIYVHFSSSGNMTYLEGTTGHFIRWQPDVSYIFDYTVTHNSTVYIEGTRKSEAIELNVDGLSPGTHKFRILAAFMPDSSTFFWGEDTVFVTVIHNPLLVPLAATMIGTSICVITVFAVSMVRARLSKTAIRGWPLGQPEFGK